MSKIIDDDFLYANLKNAEETMLNKLPLENSLSHKFSKRFNRKMRALLKYERRTPATRIFVHQLKTAVAIFILVIAMTCGTIMSVEAYRIRFFEFVTTIWQEFTSIVIESDDNADSDTLIPVDPAYIPKGYSVLERQCNEYTNSIIYVTEDGTEIYYLQKLSSQGELIIDSENTESHSILIEAQTVYTIENKGTVQVYWHDETSTFSLISSINKTELVKMAESILKK